MAERLSLPVLQHVIVVNASAGTGHGARVTERVKE